MKRAATYRRVSTADQSSAMQEDETGAFVSRREWQLVEAFADDGISGSHDRRPGFRALLEAARNRRFDVLVVWRTDRLFRSMRELLATLGELDALGVGFVSVTEPFDTTTPTGKLLFHIVGAFGEFERGVLQERTRSGLAAAKRRGAELGRPKRYVDVDRARALRRLGFTHEEIAAELGVGVATLYRALSRSPAA